MANTYYLIGSSTVGSGGSSSISFTSIPQTYTDLKFVLSLRNNRSDGNAGYMYVSLNGSTTSFSYVTLYDTGGGGVASYKDVDNTVSFGIDTDLMTANVFSNTEFYVPTYTGSTNKSWYCDNVSESNQSSNPWRQITAGLWSNTAAITSVTFTTQSGKVFKEFSTAYLYGIKNS